METTKGMTRRSFLSAAGLAGIAAGATLTGCAPSTKMADTGEQAAAAASELAWDEEADIVVVGAGAAGTFAAREAAAAGSSVIVLEKNPNVGGDMSICAGILPGYDTEYTRSNGVTATGEDCWNEYVERGENPHGLPPQDVVEYVFRNCGENIDILAEAGVEWQRLEVQAHYSAHDIFFEAHKGDVVGGGSFVEPLQSIIDQSGATLMTQTRATKLITNEEGRVIGVKATSGSDSINVKARKAVILASGGYSGNAKLIGAFAEQWKGVAGSGQPTNIGDGLLMAMELGALTTRTQDGGFILANSEYGTGANVNADCLYKGLICNQEGNRCINEGASYATNDLVDQFAAQFARQEEDYLWLVVDSSPDSLECVEVNNKTHGTQFISADTLEELAGQMGVDAGNLTQAAAAYSAHEGELVDPDYGERTSGYPIHAVAQGPFYALKLGPSIVMTTGGLKSSMTCQVLRAKSAGVEDAVTPTDDTSIVEPIPGLYAAGMIAEWTCFTGWSCTSCLTLGRLAGQNAAAEEPWE